MQPFARSFARAASGHARLQLRQGLKIAPRSGNVLGGAGAVQPSTKRSQCRVTNFGYTRRFYSDLPPSKPELKPEAESKPAESPEAPSTEAAKPTEGPDTASSEAAKSNVDEAQQTTPHELPSTTESRRSALNKKFGEIMDDLQTKLVHASQTLNDITGYTGIESIKAQNAALEVELAEAQTRVRTSRQAYKTSNTKRANTQREVTTLLARKDTWSPQDLERFTTLYRADHELEGEVAAAQEALTEAEADEQKLNQKLNSGILRRYHEEQIWSDRIRRASTWGTWGLMGMNFLLFLMLQFVAEPWKRKRLVKGVVAEEKKVLEEVKAELAAVKAVLEAPKAELVLPEASPEALAEVPTEAPANTPLEAPSEVSPVIEELEGTAPVSATAEVLEEDVPKVEPWAEFLADPSKWKEAAIDLWSERTVHLRMRDASLLALEGAAAGAAIAGSIALFMLRTSK